MRGKNRRQHQETALTLAPAQKNATSQSFERFRKFQLSSGFLGRANVASRVYRSSFGGDRDFGAQFGYKANKTFHDYLAWYETRSRNSSYQFSTT